MAQQHLTRIGQRHPAWRSDKEIGAQTTLQVLHLHGERRLCDADHLCCGSERAILRDGNEIRQLLDIHSVSAGSIRALL